MNQRLLTRALNQNAAFSGLSGFDAILFSEWLGEFFGGIGALPFIVVGASLLLFAAHLLWAARAERVSRGLAYYFIVSDLAWVAGSGVLLATGAVHSPEAMALVTVVAAIVLRFGVLQYRATTAAAA